MAPNAGFPAPAVSPPPWGEQLNIFSSFVFVYLFIYNVSERKVANLQSHYAMRLNYATGFDCMNWY